MGCTRKRSLRSLVYGGGTTILTCHCVFGVCVLAWRARHAVHRLPCWITSDPTKAPQLFQVDPSGTAFGWKATAIGKNYENAKNFLERRYNEDMELDDAVHTALLTLKESYDGEMTEHNIEVGVINSVDKVFRVLTPAEVRDYLDEAN